jgi:hypothetical protein
MQFKTGHDGVENNVIAGSTVIEPLLDEAAASKILGVSTSWLAKGRVYGYGPEFIQIGRSIRYSPSGLLNYTAARTHKPSNKRNERKKAVRD